MRLELLNFLALLSILKASLRNLMMPSARNTGISKLPEAETVFVLGNGPSLISDIEHVKAGSKDKITVVNFFASTHWFENLKPDYYFIQDSYWFDAPGALRPDVLRVFDDINERVSWPMFLCIPYCYLERFEASRIVRNPHVTVVPIPAVSLHVGDVTHFTYRSEHFKRAIFRLWSKGLLYLPATNIVSTAIFEFLKAGATNIALLGMDMTMADDLVLQENGTIAFSPSHFYGKALEAEAAKGSERDSMARAYEWIATKFRVLDLLAAYAEYLGTDVVNCSSITRLDSFRLEPLDSYMLEESGGSS